MQVLILQIIPPGLFRPTKVSEDPSVDPGSDIIMGPKGTAAGPFGADFLATHLPIAFISHRLICT